MIDILVPVLGRPQNAAPLVQNITDASTVEVNIIFLCSLDDDDQIRACLETGAQVTYTMQKSGPGDYANKINRGFKFTSMTGNEWVFQAADDLTFHHGWDTKALTAAGDTFHVVATNDKANAQVRRGQFGTHNLIRRRYVTDVGCPPLCEEYDHNFVDRELCGFAKRDGVFTFAHQSVVQHNHPLWGSAPSDPTYVKSLANFQQDRKLFLSRAHLWDYHGLSAQERRMAA